MRDTDQPNETTRITDRISERSTLTGTLGVNMANPEVNRFLRREQPTTAPGLTDADSWFPTISNVDRGPRGDRTQTNQTPASAFTEPYDQDRSRRLINDLSSGNFRSRDAAFNTLHRMGPMVLHDLAEATPRDLESRRRMEQLAGRISDTAQREMVDGFVREAPGVANTLQRAGVTVESQANRPPIGGEPVNARDFHIVSHGDPPNRALTANERRDFEQLIRRGDQLPRNFNQIHQDQTSEPNRFNAMTTVGLARDARAHYANALSASPEAADQRQARTMLSEMLDRNPSQRPGAAFTTAAARLGMDSDPAFVERFRNAGGNVNDLNSLSRDFGRWRERRQPNN